MTRRVGGAQVVGAILALLVACFCAVQLVLTFVDGYVTFDWIEYGYTPSLGYWGLVVQALGRAVCVAAAATAVSALVARSPRTARSAGVTALVSFGMLLVGEALVVADVPEYRFEVQGDIVYGWIWTFTDMVVVLGAGVLLLAAPRASTGTASGIAAPSPVADGAGPPAAAAPVTSATVTSLYFIQVAAVEYGPFDADTIRAYVAEGRVVPDTLIRPAEGYFEPASSVPGLFG